MTSASDYLDSLAREAAWLEQTARHTDTTPTPADAVQAEVRRVRAWRERRKEEGQ